MEEKEYKERLFKLNQVKKSQKDEELITKSVIIFIAFGFIASFLIYFLKEPEGFTQLYFEDYKDLPYTVDTTKEYPIRFTVVSFENEPTEYKIKATDGQKWEFILKPKENRTIAFNFKPTKIGLPTNYTIRMLNNDQSIYFWYGSSFARIKESPPEELIRTFLYKLPIEITNNELEPLSYKITSKQGTANITLNPGESKTVNLYMAPKRLFKRGNYSLSVEGNFKQEIAFKYRIRE